MSDLYQKIHRVVVSNYLNDLNVFNMSPEVFTRTVVNKIIYGVTYHSSVENLIIKVLDKIKHEDI
jgi:hypothetical protein